PKRIWARAQWLYSALFSAFFATLLSQHLLHSGFTFALLVRGQLTTLYKGRGNLLLDVVLAALAVVCAVGAVMEATRETKPAIDKGSPPNPPEGPAVDLASRMPDPRLRQFL